MYIFTFSVTYLIYLTFWMFYKPLHCKRNHFLMLVYSVKMTVTGCFEKKKGKYLFYGLCWILKKKIFRVWGKNMIGRVTPIRALAHRKMRVIFPIIPCYFSIEISSVARAFKGWATHPPRRPKWGRKWENFEKKYLKLIKIWGKMKKVEILPTRDREAGYGPDWNMCLKIGNDVKSMKFPRNYQFQSNLLLNYEKFLEFKKKKKKP